MLQKSVQTQTRQLGHACRIYKNADDTTLAIDDISIVENTRHTKDGKMLRTGYLKTSRVLVNFGGSRTISDIKMMGNYTSITADLKVATWAGNANSNDVEVSLSELPQIGDTL